MYAAVAIASKAAFFVLVPACLVARYLWPKRFSWPLTVFSATVIGWLSLIGYELLLEHARERSERAYCEQLKLENPDGVVLDYPCAIVHYAYTFNYELGWLKALIWLSPFLCVYALVKYFVGRRTKGGGLLPNTSLERTRER
jgi:hypothetical protein